MTIKCKEVRKNLVHLLSGNVTKDEAHILSEHLNTCSGCNDEKERFEELIKSLGLLERDIEVPAYLRKRVLSAIYSQAESPVPGTSYLSELCRVPGVRRALASAVFGILLTLFFGFVVSQKTDIAGLPFLLLLGLGAFWGAVYACAFSCILSRYRLAGLHLENISTLAVLTSVVVMTATYICPEKTIFQWWDASLMGTGTTKLFGSWGSKFLFGILYVLPASLLVSGIWGSRLRGGITVNGVVTSSQIILMLFPAIYVQCASLAMGLAMFWSLGSLLGAFGGVFGGLWVRHLALSPKAG